MSDPSASWSDAQRFAYALASHFEFGERFPVDVLPQTPSPELISNVLVSLAENWSATGPEDIYRLLSWLGRVGHRQSQRLSVRRYALSCRPEIAARREELRDIARTDPDALQEIWRMEAVQANRYDLLGAKLLAFDVSRAAMLGRCALLLGWGEPEMIWPFLLDMAADTQRHYSGWEEYAADYRAGFAFWNARNQRSYNDASVTRLLAAGGYWTKAPWGAAGLAVPRPERRLRADEPVWIIGG